MFGYVMANTAALSKDERARYSSVYCGICRQIRHASSQTARLTLSYDMAFLALLLMSLYEPEETGGKRACALHPIRPRPWVDNEFVKYAAQMNVALAYYKALDDLNDEGRTGAKFLASVLEKDIPKIRAEYPRQCDAITRCLDQLSKLEKENHSNPDATAKCFGALMAELLVWKEDMWAEDLRQMGMALGRFIYLADAAIDFRRDQKKHNFNPYTEENWPLWEEHLTMAMGRCTDAFERLPLVQDKGILDNILYSGVWNQFHRAKKKLSPGGTNDE